MNYDKTMILFVDFDNTLIYSHKHDIGQEKICVEKKDGKELSFMTKKSLDLLRKLSEKIKIVPVTTRTIEQFNRIDFGIKFEHALVCNGGILLHKNKIDENWKNESLALIQCKKTLENAKNILDNEENRYFENRFIENMFIFTKCKNPEIVIQKLKDELCDSQIFISSNGEKIYVIPNCLSKGFSVKRFLKTQNATEIFCAGDSEFDISMLKIANKSFVPYGFCQKYKIDFETNEMSKDKIFSDEFLSNIAHFFD